MPPKAHLPGGGYKRGPRKREELGNFLNMEIIPVCSYMYA